MAAVYRNNALAIPESALSMHGFMSAIFAQIGAIDHKLGGDITEGYYEVDCSGMSKEVFQRFEILVEKFFNRNPAFGDSGIELATNYSAKSPAFERSVRFKIPNTAAAEKAEAYENDFSIIRDRIPFVVAEAIEPSEKWS